MSRHAFRFGVTHIDPLPGQPQVAHCHSFFVPVPLRGQGNGHRLKTAQMDQLQAGHYDFALCTVDGKNIAQQTILTQAGWHQLADFKNTKTGGVTELWGCPVQQASQS